MALKHSQQLKLSQKLLPQQILLMKLLQLPTLALEDRIKEELEANPALEEDLNDKPEEEIYSNEETDNSEEIEFDEQGEAKEDESKVIENDVVMEDYMDDEELDSYKYEISNKGADEETREFVVVEGAGFQEQLEQQQRLEQKRLASNFSNTVTPKQKNVEKPNDELGLNIYKVVKNPDKSKLVKGQFSVSGGRKTKNKRNRFKKTKRLKNTKKRR